MVQVWWSPNRRAPDPAVGVAACFGAAIADEVNGVDKTIGNPPNAIIVPLDRHKKQDAPGNEAVNRRTKSRQLVGFVIRGGPGFQIGELDDQGMIWNGRVSLPDGQGGVATAHQ